MHHYHSTAHDGVSTALNPSRDAILAMALVVVLAPVTVSMLLSHPAVAVGFAAGMLLGHLARMAHRLILENRAQLRRLLGGSERRADAGRRHVSGE